MPRGMLAILISHPPLSLFTQLRSFNCILELPALSNFPIVILQVMASPPASLSPGMQQYLTECSPAQISAIVDAIREIQSPSVSFTADPNNDMTHQQQQPVDRTRRSKPKKVNKVTKFKANSKARSSAINPSAAKRPLNSWMAFRSMCCSTFLRKVTDELRLLLPDLLFSAAKRYFGHSDSSLAI